MHGFKSRLLVSIAAACLFAAPAMAQQMNAYHGADNAIHLVKPTDGLPEVEYRPGTQLLASSGTVVNASAAATLAAGGAAVMTYITGFQCTGAGATAALNVDVAVTGLSTALHYAFTFPAGAAVQAAQLAVAFEPPVAAGAKNTAIVVTMPAGGSGNTSAACSAQGFSF